jgi:hypothetical protein
MKTANQCGFEHKEILELMERRKKEHENSVEEGNVRKSNWFSTCTNCVHVDDQPIMASVDCEDDFLKIAGIKIQKKESLQANAKCIASRISGNLSMEGQVFLVIFNLKFA